MRAILLTLLILGTFSAFGQINLPRSLEQVVEYNSDGTSVFFTVANVSDETSEFYWDLVKADGLPIDWEFKVCDTNTCYDWGQSQPCDAPSQIPANSSYTFYVYLKPNDIKGEHNLTFRILAACDSDSELLAETTISWKVQGSVSAQEELSSSDIIIYPNPTTDRFEVSDDSNISELVIFNIVGKQVLADSHRKGQIHDISVLQKGIYLVRMLDDSHKILKVIRLTKK